MNTICTKNIYTCGRERTLSREENNIVIVQKEREREREREREQQQHNNLV